MQVRSFSFKIYGPLRHLYFHIFSLSCDTFKPIHSDAIANALNLKLTPAVEMFAEMYLEEYKRISKE